MTWITHVIAHIITIIYNQLLYHESSGIGSHFDFWYWHSEGQVASFFFPLCELNQAVEKKIHDKKHSYHHKPILYHD